jgi:predicted RecA/RadA family phage recombinase
MKTFIQNGDVVTVTAPTGGVTAGDGVIVGNLFGVAAISAAEGQAVEIATRGVHVLAKQPTAVIAAGAQVAWDVVEKRIDLPDTGLYPVGTATEAAGNANISVRVRLDGVATAAAA